MDPAAKKPALPMIPYGMFVLTTKSKDGKDISAATVNWVTQASFQPPLVAIGVKADSSSHGHIKETGVFALNVIGKEQINLAFNFSNRTSTRETTSVVRSLKQAKARAARFS